MYLKWLLSFFYRKQFGFQKMEECDFKTNHFSHFSFLRCLLKSYQSNKDFPTFHYAPSTQNLLHHRKKTILACTSRNLSCEIRKTLHWKLNELDRKFFIYTKKNFFFFYFWHLFFMYNFISQCANNCTCELRRKWKWENFWNLSLSRCFVIFIRGIFLGGLFGVQLLDAWIIIGKFFGIF